MFRLNTDLSNTQLREAYEDLFMEGWLGSRQAVLTWLIKGLAIAPGDQLLDIACGDAQLSSYVEATGGIYFGVDFAEPALRRFNYQHLTVADGMNLPFGNGRFQWVTCIGSLEHFHKLDQGIREIKRVLRSGGCGIILVPNAFSLTWNLLHVWRFGQIADDDRQPQQGFATRTTWENLLLENGLEVIKVVGYEQSWPHSLSEWQRNWQNPREGLLGLLSPFIPLNLRRCFVFFCQHV